MVAIVHMAVGHFEDSWQPTGQTKFDPWPHAQMKKLVHTRVLHIDGPNTTAGGKVCQPVHLGGLVGHVAQKHRNVIVGIRLRIAPRARTEQDNALNPVAVDFRRPREANLLYCWGA